MAVLTTQLQAVKDAEHKLYQTKVDYICCTLNSILNENQNMNDVAADVRDFILDTYATALRINRADDY